MSMHLRPDILWCEANHRIALLDLTTQRYFTLSPRGDAAFRRLISHAPPHDDDADALAGVITNSLERADSLGSKLASIGHLPIAARSALTDGAQGHTSLYQIALALIERLMTRRQIATTPFRDMIEALSNRRSGSDKSDGVLNSSAHENAISAFLMTSRFVKIRDRCLDHSIAMVRFLARFGYYPRLVLGVKMSPWGAHAWVQDGDLVLNDSVDRVRAYTPILVV